MRCLRARALTSIAWFTRWQVGTEAELRRALAGAKDGDVICMRPGICVVQSPVIVKVGVTIRSAGPAAVVGGATIIQGL
jgi:hypothetical protein